jgi:hypothetical protein
MLSTGWHMAGMLCGFPFCLREMFHGERWLFRAGDRPAPPRTRGLPT